MPAGLANHAVENQRGNLFNNRPLMANWLLHAGIQAVRQHASAAQQDRVHHHGCTFLEIADTLEIGEAVELMDPFGRTPGAPPRAADE